MIVLNKTQALKKHKCVIKVSEIKEKHLIVCKVECSGKARKNTWTHRFFSIYGGYAMLLEKDLIDLPGKLFMVCQINEHSKGGHCEYEMQLMDLQGKVLNQFSSNYHSTLLLDDKYLWFLKSGKTRYDFTSDRDLDLVKLNINTGQVKQTIKLNYPQLLNCAYSFVLGITLTVKKNTGLLKIEFKDELKYNSVKHIPITKL